MSFADKLVHLRTQRSMSQEELAAELGVSRQTISKWENGLASPEMSGLIALSEYYAISIDALVKDQACETLTPVIPDPNMLGEFLLRAKRSTYAAHAPETSPSRPDSHDFVYSEDSLTYRDSYFGGSVFHGEETVWEQGRAIWCMNYSGRTLSPTFSGDFLKQALLRGTSDAPYRGPTLFQQNGYTYICKPAGSINWFSGEESIFFGKTLVYECRFHGGLVK